MSYKLRALAAFAAVCIAAPAAAQPILDCPMRTERYSVDTPLFDILRKPEAVAVVERELPGTTKGIGQIPNATKAPSITAILTIRSLTKFNPKAQDIGKLDAALRALPVTVADQRARCERYDDDKVAISVPEGSPRVLLFEKMTGFRDGPSVEAARAAFEGMAKRNGWALVVTGKGGAIRPDVLRQFDLVIWNNVSGDVLTLKQRKAFRDYVERGGGYLGVHGSAGDFAYHWGWYPQTLIGAQFIGHPMGPQFQDARVVVEAPPGMVGGDLAPGWTMKDEWYSFDKSPRAKGVRVVATLDERSYSPKGQGGQQLAMGADHPIIWSHCVGSGRSFYSAIGHRPETYSDPNYVKLLEQAVPWAAGKGKTVCKGGKEVAR